MMKRMLSMFLTFVIVLGIIPGMSLTAFAEGGETTYDLWIGGEQFTSGNLTISGGSGAATYDPSNNTLTLNNYTYSGSGRTWDSGESAAAIYYNGSAALTLNLVGENSVTQTNNIQECSSHGVYAAGDITVSGSGSLTATGGSGLGSVGVYVNTLCVTSGSLTATGGEASSLDSSGIEASNITISGGKVIAIGGTTSGNRSYSQGIKANNNISISGGTVIANGGTASSDYTNSTGIKASTISISGGETIAQGEDWAFSTKPTIESTFNASVWYGDSEDAATKAGAQGISNLGSNYSAKYVKVAETVPYTVTIAETIVYGTVATDKTTATAGESVTLTVSPLAYYTLKSLTVMQDKTSVGFTDNGDGTYSFPMPAGDITVDAQFMFTKAISAVEFAESITTKASSDSVSLNCGFTFAGNANLSDYYDNGGEIVIIVNGTEANDYNGLYECEAAGLTFDFSNAQTALTAEKAGTYTISLTVPAAYTYSGVAITKTMTLTVTDQSELTVGGVEVMSEGVVKNSSGEGWSFTPKTNTLTLNGAEITGVSSAGSKAGIYSNLSDLKIVLSGNSTVAGASDSERNGKGGHGIHSNGNITLSGTGSLTVTGGSANGVSGTGGDGIYTDSNGTITIDGGTINATGGSGTGGSGTSGDGIYAKSDSTITISGGTINATGGSGVYGGHGIYAHSGGTITISGGTITATGTAWGGGYGVYAANALTISDGIVTATGSVDAGIGGGTITINGGIINATGGSAQITGNGIWAGTSGTITINGGTVEATGGVNCQALKKAPVLTGYTGGYTARASTSVDGSDAVTYDPANNANYKYFKIEPATPFDIGISISPAAGGSVSAPAWAAAGTTVTLTVTPNDGYSLSSLTANDVAVTDNQFTMPAEDVTVSAVFRFDGYTFTIDEPITNGTVTADKSTPAGGETVTLTVAPNTGCVLTKLDVTAKSGNPVTVTELGDGRYTFVMPTDSSVTVSAEFKEAIGYIDGTGAAKTCIGFSTVTADMTDWSDGWYVVRDNVPINGTVTLSGDVKLILCDGASLTITGGTDEYDFGLPGIQNGNLTIYGQTNGTGALTVNGAGMGMENINVLTVNGGNVTVSGGDKASDAYGIWTRGSVTVNCGSLTAQAGRGSGLQPYGDGIYAVGGVTVTGGSLTATGSDFGGDGIRGSLTITGGMVTAAGSSGGSGIDGNVTMTGGSLEATGSNAGIIDTTNHSALSNKPELKGSFAVTTKNFDGTVVPYDPAAVGDYEVFKAEPGAAHSITIPTVTDGTVKANYSEQAAGWKIVLTVTSDTGYHLSSLAVTDASDAAVTVNSDNTFTMPDANVTITAAFAANTHDIIYMVDNVEYLRVKDVAYGTAITPIDAPTKENYTFSGWQNVPATMPDEDVTITGIFTINKYKVTWSNGDGGSYEQNVAYGETITVPNNEFFHDTIQKAGYTLTGWANTEDYAVGGAMPAQELTFTAQYTAHTYTVRFNANGGIGSMADMAFTYGVSQTLTANAFTNGELYFNGWNTAADGSGTAYTNEESVSNLTVENGGVITLHAQWSDKQVQLITFDTSDRTATYGDSILEARTATAEGAISYSSSDTTIATVDANGVVTVLKAGEVTITVFAAETDAYIAGSASYKLTVVPKELTVTPVNKSVYVGAQKPDLSASVSGADYTVSGLVDGDTVSVTLYYVTEPDMAKTGEYGITATVTDTSGNYAITVVDGKLTVRTRPSSGGGGYTPPVQNVTVPISGDENTIHVDAKVKGGKATVDHVDLDHLDEVIGDHVNTDTVTIDFSGLNSNKPITTVEIPASAVKEIAEAVNDPTNDAHSFEVILSDGTSIEFDAVALGKKAAQADGLDITISIENAKDARPNQKQEAALKGRPAYDITVTSGGEHISDMGGKITIHAPYELQDGEHPRGIIVWYVDEDGKRERCQTSYDNVKKQVTWKTDHLSLYMIDYCHGAAYEDVDTEAWYHEAVDYVIENELMGGYGGGVFKPNGNVTRQQVWMILARMSGKAPADMAEARVWAMETGVSDGTDPTAYISRQQFATMLWRYAKETGVDVSVGEDTNILSYTDAFDISEYAVPAMQWACGAGVMGGYNDGSLKPLNNAARAHLAKMLMNYLEP